MKLNIRLLYLYLFSFVGLLIAVIGSIQLVDLGLKTYVFRVDEYRFVQAPIPADKDAVSIADAEVQRVMMEQDRTNQIKRQVSNSLAMIVIGVPLYLYHWTTIKRENRS